MRVCLGIHSAVAWAAMVRACAWAWRGGPLGCLGFQVDGSATARAVASRPHTPPSLTPSCHTLCVPHVHVLALFAARRTVEEEEEVGATALPTQACPSPGPSHPTRSEWPATWTLPFDWWLR
jgi:hypothetical protein